MRNNTSLEVWFYNASQKWNDLLMLHNSFKTVTMKLHGLLSILDVYYKKIEMPSYRLNG